MKQLFGTDGIRTKVGNKPLTKEHLPYLAQAIAAWVIEKYKQPNIFIATDTRPSCSWIKKELINILLQSGCNVFDGGILPTPIVNLLTTHKKYDVGIMISASHNLAHDNGIKIMCNGYKITADEAQIINQNYSTKKPIIIEKQRGKKIELKNIYNEYFTIIQSYFPKHFLKNLPIVIDCAYGATRTIAPRLFTDLGATVTGICATQEGYNINKNCGSTHPEKLRNMVLSKQADIGFAFDGDGDRVVAVSKNGTIKDGDDLLALLLTHPLYKNSTGVVGTIMTNHGLAQHLTKHNKQLFRTPVGDTHVVTKMLEAKIALGGEQSGHIIMGDYMYASDGIFTALRVLEAILHTKNWKLESFTRYPQILINIPVQKKVPLQAPVFTKIIARYEQQLPNGRLIVRYSGTEPVLRVMIEGVDKLHAKNISTQLIKSLTHVLSLDGAHDETRKKTTPIASNW